MDFQTRFIGNIGMLLCVGIGYFKLKFSGGVARIVVITALALNSLTAYSNISEVMLISNGFLVDHPIANSFFVDEGDTVRFSWQVGTHAVQSTSVPSGAPTWSFQIDSVNSTEDVIITLPGYYHFSINGGISTGIIICRDTLAPLRYFEFSISPFPPSENFVVASSDAVVLQAVDSLLTLPLNQRFMMIKGLLAHGNDGYNYNWSWRFQESRWRMVEVSEEVCDGWSTFVEDSVNYWVDFLGYFCPWNSRLEKEVFPGTNTINENRQKTLTIYPNPAFEELFIRNISCSAIKNITLTDTKGSQQQCIPLLNGCRVDLSNVPSGVYILQIAAENEIRNSLVIVQ